MTPSAQTAGGRRVRRWTRELIIEKILEWEARYGEPPGSADWNPSLARWRAQEWRAERYRDGVWPSTNAAKRPFGGSFDAAVRAAGLEPHRPGPKRRAAGAARPAVEQRAAVAARAGTDDELTAALGRVAALERSLLVAEGRAERAEAKVSDARRRARRASARPGEAGAGDEGEARGRAGRARRARDRVRVVRSDARTQALERVEELIADADARVCAADDQAEAAVRDAADARAATAAAERRARELSALVADGQRRLTGGELAALREGGASGPTVLAAALKRLARARAAGDRGGLDAALAEVASAAVRWRDRL